MPFKNKKLKREFYSDRTKRIVTFTPDNIADKEAIEQAASDCNRSVNAWLIEFILPYALTVARGQIAKKAKNPLRGI